LKVKKAIRPSITFIIGQPASGKTTLALKLNECHSSTYINANKFKGKDDFETVKKLSEQLDKVPVGTSVVVEDFPQNAEQAYLFSKN
jgi:AAA15 family ATPase/GTPase